MTEGAHFLGRFFEQVAGRIHTAMPCRVERVKESENKCDVLPLFKQKLEDGSSWQRSIINNVPYIKHRYEYEDTLDSDSGEGDTEKRYVKGPVYEAGDIVLVVFLERAGDRLDSYSVPFDPASHRKHDLQDAMIVGLIR